MSPKYFICAVLLFFTISTQAMELQLVQAVAHFNPPCPITVPYMKKTVDTWVDLGIKDLNHPNFNHHISYTHSPQNYHSDAMFFKQHPNFEKLYKKMCYKVFDVHDEKPRILVKEALKKRRSHTCKKDPNYTTKIDTMFVGTAANIKKYTEAKKEYPALNTHRVRSDVQIRILENQETVEVKTQLLLSTAQPQSENFITWLCSFFAYYEQ